MSQTIEIETVVQPGGKIEVSSPALTPGQRAKVVITTDENAAPTEGRHVLDIINSLPGYQLFKTAEEVDAYIREERDSWDR
ncbi:MAG TPA: hypothetical protein VF116_23140 [Ktedonobacterales bacterium]